MGRCGAVVLETNERASLFYESSKFFRGELRILKLTILLDTCFLMKVRCMAGNPI
jgi:hypothetical protein